MRFRTTGVTTLGFITSEAATVANVMNPDWPVRTSDCGCGRTPPQGNEAMTRTAGWGSRGETAAVHVGSGKLDMPRENSMDAATTFHEQPPAVVQPLTPASHRRLPRRAPNGNRPPNQRVVRVILT